VKSLAIISARNEGHLSKRFDSLAGKLSFDELSEPDWAAVAREMKRPGVNLVVLWEEYREVEPNGYGYRVL
jgi:transposase